MNKPLKEKAKHGQRDPIAFQWQVAGIWATALAIRLAYIWQVRPSPFFDVLLGDARRYDAWAQQISAGDWVGQGVFYQAPLYPYFLATIYSIVGRDLLIARICQAVVGATGCALLALAVRRIYSERAGLIAGLGLAIYAPAVFFDGVLQKSVLDLFFVSLVLWLLSGFVDSPSTRARWFSLGLALGGLALTRENGLVLIAPILLWRVLQSDVSWKSQGLGSSVLALALGLLLTLSPVAIRNRIVGGEWHMTTSQFGPNFYLGNNPDADGTAGTLREGRGSVEYEQQDATNLAQAAEGRSLTPREVSHFWTRRTLAFIAAEPWAWLKLEVRKVMLLTNSIELVDTESQESYEEWSPVLRGAALVGRFGVLAPIAALGLVVGWPRRKRLWLYAALAATYAASVVVFYVSARYRLPLVPFLMVFAGIGLSGLPDAARAARGARGLLVAAGLILLAVFVNWPVWSPALMQAATENNLANTLQIERRYQEAELYYRRAMQLQPEYVPPYVNLGEMLLAQDRPGEAIDVLKHVRVFAPDSVDVDGRLGTAYLRTGQFAEAVASFQHALQRGNTTADVYMRLTASLIAEKRREEALAVFHDAIERHPGNSALRFRFGTLLLEERRFLEAIVQLKAGLSISPNTAEGHGNLGAALAAAGRPEEAIPQFEEALRLKPDLTSAQRNLEIVRRAVGGMK